MDLSTIGGIIVSAIITGWLSGITFKFRKHDDKIEEVKDKANNTAKDMEYMKQHVAEQKEMNKMLSETWTGMSKDIAVIKNNIQKLK